MLVEMNLDKTYSLTMTNDGFVDYYLNGVGKQDQLGQVPAPVQLVACVGKVKSEQVEDCHAYISGADLVADEYLYQLTQTVRIIVAATGKTLASKTFRGSYPDCDNWQSGSLSTVDGTWRVTGGDPAGLEAYIAADSKGQAKNVPPAPKAGTRGVFTATGSMAQARSEPLAVLLKSGRVLVVGGRDDGGDDLASAELYDPKTGRFSPTGSMSVARGAFSATLLKDGRVLIAGGMGLASAELYDPKTGKFSPTGSMTTMRMGHTATLLQDGQVLLGGVYDASAELYDPKSGKFSPTGSMTTQRNTATATLLSDGRVLIVGGWGETSQDVASAEIYSPKTGKFSPTGSLHYALTGASSVLLRDGRVLVIGAENSRRVFPPETAEAYNPKTGKFDEDVPNPACDVCTATALHSGWLLVAGGNDESGDPVASAQLANASSYDVKPTGSMTYPRADATATVLQDGRVLIVGGHGEASILASAELYQP